MRHLFFVCFELFSIVFLKLRFDFCRFCLFKGFLVSLMLMLLCFQGRIKQPLDGFFFLPNGSLQLLQEMSFLLSRALSENIFKLKSLFLHQRSVFVRGFLFFHGKKLFQANCFPFGTVSHFSSQLDNSCFKLSCIERVKISEKCFINGRPKGLMGLDDSFNSSSVTIACLIFQ